MKKGISLIALICFTASVFASTFGVVQTRSNAFQLSSFDANMQATEINTITLQFDAQLLNNSFFYDVDKGMMGFVAKSNGLSELVVTDLLGKINSVFQISGTITGVTYLPELGSVGFIQTEQNFNGYGNNDEDIRFVVLDLETGIQTNNVPLDGVSFEAMSLPVFGTVKQSNAFGGHSNITKEMSISLPTYISKRDEIQFFATDVMGNQKLFRIGVSQNRLISTQTVFHNILDFNYVNPNLYKVICAEKVDGVIQVCAADFNPNNGSLFNKVRVDQFQSEVLSDGNILFDEESGEMKVTMGINNTKNVYTITAATNEVSLDVKQISASSDIALPSYGNRFSSGLGNQLNVYPNPSNGIFNVENFREGINQIEVLNIHGQQLKVLVVDADDIFTKTQIDLTEFARGTYFIKTSINEEVYLNKIIKD